MRLVFFNRFYLPDHSATAQLLGDVAQYFASTGHEVIVVASRARYGGGGAPLAARETIGGVTIIRTWAPRHGGGMVGRIVAYLFYYLAALFHTMELGADDAVLVAKTDPPVLSLVVGIGSVIAGGRLICWVQDLFPEVAQAFGMRIGGGRIGWLIRRLRNWSLQRAVCVVAIGDLMAERIAAQGIAPGHILTIPNWTNDRAITPLAHRSLALRAEWQIDPAAFVLTYSGNLGRAHECDTVLGAAERLRDRADIVFLFIGGGHVAQQLAARVAALDLTSFRFLPYQPRDRLIDSIGIGDAHWLSLRPAFEGLIVPSKVFGICAAGRPVIAICARDGEILRMLPPGEASIHVAPGDSAALAAAIVELAANPARCEAIGAAGRLLIERNYCRDRALRRWQALLDGIIADNAALPH
jgi:colanic acid biosynthesis glycosyl transferase WcaI